MSDTLFVGDRLYRHLFADLFRPLTEAERDRLRDSLRVDGLLLPIVCDERGGILDGWERLCLLVELGREPELRFDVRQGLKHFADKQRLAVALNDARRHLTPEDRAALAVALRSEGGSLRSIGARLGVSSRTVALDLDRADVPKPDHVIGADGRQYPATRLEPEALTARRAEAQQLREAGHTVGQIAAMLGVSVGTVVADGDASRLAAELEDLDARGLRTEAPIQHAPRVRKTSPLLTCPFCARQFAAG